MSEKTYRIVMSERCFRFKPDAVPGHAPGVPGVYEFVTFDEGRDPKVLFVGCAPDQPLQARLMEHLLGSRKPTAVEMIEKYKDVYFDYVAKSSEQAPDDLKDIAGALAAKHRPPYNEGPVETSGRFEKVHLKEVEIL